MTIPTPPRPAFYITGATLPDGSAIVYASSTVFEGEILYENELEDLYLNQTYTFTAKSHTITSAKGPDFASALRDLFAKWTPAETPKPKLSQAPRMLDQ